MFIAAPPIKRTSTILKMFACMHGVVINRPGVVRAVLQTLLSLIN